MTHVNYSTMKQTTTVIINNINKPLQMKFVHNSSITLVSVMKVHQLYADIAETHVQHTQRNSCLLLATITNRAGQVTVTEAVILT